MLSSLANVAFLRGDRARAQALQKESLTIGRDLGDPPGIARGLEGLAGMAHEQNELSRATRLWGAAAALRERIGNPRSPADQNKAAERWASVRAELGDAVFTAAWDAGRAMTMEQAVEFALGDF